MALPPANPPNQVYDDFQPNCRWVKEEGFDTLLVFLPGFGKEQIKVQITCKGNLRVKGERQVGGNRWSRFCKEMPIKPIYNGSKISAKYENGVLFVKHPKTIASVPAGPCKEAEPAAEPSQQNEVTEPPKSPKPPATEPEEGKKPDCPGAVPPKKEEPAPPSSCICQVLKPMNYKQAIGDFLETMKKPRNLITTVAAVLLVVVLGLSVKTAIKSLGQPQSSRPKNKEL